MNVFSQLASLVPGSAGAAAHGSVGPVAQPVDLLWLIVLAPLVGFALNALVGVRLQRTFGKRVNHGIAIGAMLVSWGVAVYYAVKMAGAPVEGRLFHQHLWTILEVGQLRVPLAFALDPLSMLMVLIITTIGTLIHVYSIGYMADEPSYWRFFAYLNLFVFAMLMLVMGDNLGVMFFGWEGVGLASYLLIGFWYEDIDKARAGMKAFVVNRIGDFGFLVGLFVLFWALAGTFGPVEGATPTLMFHELRDQFTTGGVGQALAAVELWGLPVVAVICLCLFVGAAGKSAQLPLYVWLPDAMAGPTPVSALIHAATMVTAGVYMIGRLNFIYALSPLAMTVVAVVGAATALFAASIGFVQNDIKKVLAYSTISQLGFMFIGVGVGAYWTGVYHLLTHAFFKATLFLAAGAVIVGCHHEQDMRKMGGLKKVLPLTERAYFYACVCITAAPVFFLGNGFFSKDEILWNAFRAGGNLLIPGWTIWMAGWIAAAGTAFYMWRSYYLTFSGEYRGEHGVLAHDPPVAAVPAATHSVGAAHAATFDADVLASASIAAAHARPATAGGPHAVAVAVADLGAHGHHGGAPRDVSRTMSYVLAALSVGSIATIFLGLWAPLGHLLHIDWLSVPLLEKWLAPVLPGAAITAARQTSPSIGVEWLLIAASIVVALGGWAIARSFYKDARSETPARLAAAWPRLHRWVHDKYYVDELFAATVLRAVAWAREACYWFDRTVIDGVLHAVAWVTRAVANLDDAIDKYLVDGAVNLVGRGALAFGQRVRRLQTGRIQSYLYGALVGALAFIGLSYLIGR